MCQSWASAIVMVGDSLIHYTESKTKVIIVTMVSSTINSPAKIITHVLQLSFKMVLGKLNCYKKH